MAADNLLTEWATLLLASLADAGLRDVVISPGSRSTPFVVAAVRERRLRCHNVIDERAAAFFALGQARMTCEPSLLICTSGTAGAHYLPAIIEAGHSHIPLIVLTADRPPEFWGCAAPQTIDQTKLFGGHVRHFFELGSPEGSEGALRGLRRVAAQARFSSRWPLPGAVHINAPARKPLEPTQPSTPEGEALAALAACVAASPITSVRAPRSLPVDADLDDLTRNCVAAKRGLIVCGPAPLEQLQDAEAIFALSAATQFPILCEGTSQLRFAIRAESAVSIDAVEPLLSSNTFRANGDPDYVLQLGAPPISAGWERLAPRVSRAVIAPHGWNDPQSSASALVLAEPAVIARALCARLAPSLPNVERSAWRSKVAEANERARAIVEATLANAPSLTEGHVAKVVTDNLPEQSSLVLGNSLAVRLIDTYCANNQRSIGVLSQRGASGIDGLIAGTIGAATHTKQPITLLLGDVTFLHDLTSLCLAKLAAASVVIVVMQNNGGRIFEQLPLASAADIEPEIIRHTTTPHAINSEHAARLFDVGFVRVEDTRALTDALAHAYSRQTCTVIEAVVAPHGAAPQLRAILAATDASLVDIFGA